MSDGFQFPGGQIQIDVHLKSLRMAMVHRLAEFTESFLEQAKIAVDQAVDAVDVEAEMASAAKHEVMNKINESVRAIVHDTGFELQIKAMVRDVIDSDDFKAKVEEYVVAEIGKVAERLAQDVLYRSDVRHKLHESIEDMLMRGLTERIHRRGREG